MTELRFLTRSDILRINKEMTLAFGGLFVARNNNVINDGSLCFLIEAVKKKVYGRDLYPDFFDKVTAYACNVIRNHVFVDGNKRTGMCSAVLFLNRNGYAISNRHDDEIVRIGNGIAEGKLSPRQVRAWFEKRARRTRRT